MAKHDGLAMVVGELMRVSAREKRLIEFGRQLDPNKRHFIMIEYRGNEPWKIQQRITETLLSLMPGAKTAREDKKE